jgi:single-stranded-DNA-specific exonuclease
MGTGSGRSIAGFDLGRLVREAVEKGLVIKGGGHAMAAGITIERARLGDLRAFFEERAAAEVTRLASEETLKIDAALSAEGATVELLDTLEHAGPYGSGHPAPVLVLPRHRITDIRIVGNGHMRVGLRSEMGGSLQAMAFRAENTALGAFLAANRGQTVHVAGLLSSNFWNGRRSAHFRIADAAAVT